MQEIRLELDEAKLNAIIMELDVLHRAVAPEIVEFYGAFFIESCVYYCMEYMDAGSMDKLQVAGVPEEVLAKIALSMVRGLKFLKDELQIIHRGEGREFKAVVHNHNLLLRCEAHKCPCKQEG
jgi:mitogen-activated protein kinase kinase